MLGIMIHKGWLDETTEMARQIEMYAETQPVHKALRYEDYLTSKDIKRDDSHLTISGNCV